MSRVGIAIPQLVHRRSLDPRALATFLRGAEELGFESIWVHDDVLGSAGFLEPFVVLGHAAALTTRLRIGVAVVISTVRSPVGLAKSVVALDQVSGGRLTLGVGLGANTRIYPAFGLGTEGRVRRFREGLALMKRLWAEDEVSFAGEFWRLDRATLEPKPVQRPHPPLWLGARAPAALRRAVELGDGWIGAGRASTAEFRRQAIEVRECLDRAHRDPATFSIAKRVYVAVDRDRGRVRRRLQESLAMIYGNDVVAEEIALMGEVEQVAEGVDEVRAAGAELLILNPLFDELDHMEILARDVLPLVGMHPSG